MGKSCLESRYQTLRSLVEDRFVVDFGCADGHVAKAFDPDKYLGIEFNEDVLDIARKNNPDHAFGTIDALPEHAECVLFYFVCFHIDHDSIEGFLSQISAGRVIIVEIMEGMEPSPLYETHPRNPGFYEDVMTRHGYNLVDIFNRQYAEHYHQPVTFMVFDKVFLK